MSVCPKLAKKEKGKGKGKKKKRMLNLRQRVDWIQGLGFKVIVQ